MIDVGGRSTFSPCQAVGARRRDVDLASDGEHFLVAGMGTAAAGRPCNSRQSRPTDE